MSWRPQHLAIATGGTGGHFFPALAIALEFRRREGNVSFILAGQQSEEHRRVVEENGMHAFDVPAVRLPATALHTLGFAWRMLGAYRDCRRLLKALHADMLLGMGSFAAVPPGLAAARLGVPVFLHEGNAIPGRANRLLARRARVMATSLPLIDPRQISCPQVCTGLPLRQSLLHAAAVPPPRSGIRQELGLLPDKPVLLVFGGSQGAAFLNNLITRTVEKLGDRASNFQLLVLTGANDASELPGVCRAIQCHVRIQRWESAMERCYLAADLVLARGGASTIAELALFGKPAILVPLPMAADNHQKANVDILSSQDAAACLEQGEQAVKECVKMLNSWINMPEEWLRRAENIRRLAHPNAARAVVDMLFNPKFNRA